MFMLLQTSMNINLTVEQPAGNRPIHSFDLQDPCVVVMTAEIRWDGMDGMGRAVIKNTRRLCNVVQGFPKNGERWRAGIIVHRMPYYLS